MSQLTDYLHGAVERRDKKLIANSKKRRWERKNCWASDLGPCAREMTLAILRWEERPEFDVGLLARFEAGSKAETPAISRIQELGVKVVETQLGFTLKGRKGGIVLSGKCDGKVLIERARYPFDYKTVSQFVFPRLNTVQDFMDSPFHRKWVHQLWSYLIGHGHETGFLWLDNLIGEWKFIEISLDYGAMEELIQRCETVMDAVAAIRAGGKEEDRLPPYHMDPMVCQTCWAKNKFCFPGQQYGGVGFCTDPEKVAVVSAELDRHQEIKPLYREYDRLHNRLKERFRDTEGQTVIGDYIVQGQPQLKIARLQEEQPQEEEGNGGPVQA